MVREINAMSSSRRKLRRQEQRESRRLTMHETQPAPAILRVARPEDENNVPCEPIPSRCASQTVGRTGLNGGCNGVAQTEAGRHLLVAAAPARFIELRRSFDHADINPILNDPDIFRFVGAAGVHSLDATPLLHDKRNVLLMADGGGILFCWHSPCCYEVHTNFIKPKNASLSHGKHVLQCSLAAYRWMFTHTDCAELLTMIPKHNRSALRLAPLAGWVLEFERKSVWPSVDAGMVDAAFYSIRYDDWVRRTIDLMLSGVRFHAELEKEVLHFWGRELERPSMDEDAHYMHIGAFMEMIEGGQIEKAIALYNRWAIFARVGCMSLISAAQKLIDVGSSLIQVQSDGTFKVLEVR